MENDPGNVKIYGLLGRNINYSLSPVMHNAAFRHFDIAGEYRLFDVPEDDLEGFLRQKVLSGELSGFNVTVPYKIAVIELLKKCSLLNVQVDEWVDVIGAVNTVKIDGRNARLSNTDTNGFLRSLISDLGFDPNRIKRFFVVGAGGAGRAIALFLGRMVMPEKICIYDIDRKKLFSLRNDFLNRFPDKSPDTVRLIEKEEDIAAEAGDCQLLVNATPLGTREGDPMPVPAEVLRQDLSVYDLVYARETELIKAARDRGAAAAGGLGMLVGQGALSFTIWTGADADETRRVMMDAAKERLGI